MLEGKLIDLHLHSTYSDGQLTPGELINAAMERGISAVALADHDSVDGVAEFVDAAGKIGMESISCVELSCIHAGRDLHILGYGVDAGNDTFQGMLARFRERRERRGIEIVEKLSEQNIHIDVEEVLKKAGGGSLGRPHIAKELIENGYAKDFAEVFEKYIGENCPAYVDKYRLSPSEAVKYIRGADGLAFVAHPGFYIDDVDVFFSLLEEGFDGIEVYHSKHNTETTVWLRKVANERGLLESGGSDFHGFSGRDNIGEPKVPYEHFVNIRERLAGRS